MPCCAGHAQSHNVWRLHSPLHLKPLEAGGWGRSWCLCFLKVVRCVVVVCWEMAFCACSDFVTWCWCLARIWIKSTICRVWYEHTTPIFSRSIWVGIFFGPYVIWRADRERCSQFVKVRQNMSQSIRNPFFHTRKMILATESPYLHTKVPIFILKVPSNIFAR